MSEYLPIEIRTALADADRPETQRRPRRSIRVGGHSFTILSQWDGGFALDAATAPLMRGRVDVYEDTRHVAQGLVYATSEEDGRRNYAFKRQTPCLDGPALDYARPSSALRGLLT